MIANSNRRGKSPTVSERERQSKARDLMIGTVPDYSRSRAVVVKSDTRIHVRDGKLVVVKKK